ncbi:hypothetical protein BP5796_00202 [Coleophoma crateriformis]|uniref:3-ketosteroid reductase n=1 Tax=Coleophoma crateriformis TaxID=565419 RepID=A0A3D8T7C5_9HELO|nr:hypothetical protein BP5796_00202 [Coleophoma crateriformis]
MGLPPWETSESQLFALITGANSGLGYGIATRMIDEFLTSPSTPPTKHLVLIVTTRTPLKTRFTLSRLRQHLRSLAEYSDYSKKQQKLARAQGREYNWEDTVQRVHFLGVEVDLCDLKSVYALADKLVNGTLGTPDATTYDGLKLPAGSPGTAGYKPDVQQDQWALSQAEGSTGRMRSWGWGLSDIKIPRLDVVVCNAGIGGWYDLHWPKAVWTILTDMIEATTWPIYKLAEPQRLLRPQCETAGEQGSGEETQSLVNKKELSLGNVFCANLFGHYILTHEIMPLLSKPASPSATAGGKIIWITSIEAVPSKFSLDDIQGLKSLAPYESSKRLTDILSISSTLPAAEKASDSFFDQPKAEGSIKSLKPRLYVAHPGIFASEIFPLPWLLACFMEAAFYVARWLGSPWHPIKPYKAAVAPVWIALADDEQLERMNATRSKWGSATDRLGHERVMRTEVGGWGWDGVDHEGGHEGETKIGRQRGAVDATKESREEFEMMGAKCWRAMEGLRKEWEEVLHIKDQK